MGKVSLEGLCEHQGLNTAAVSPLTPVRTSLLRPSPPEGDYHTFLTWPGTHAEL